MAHTPLTLRKAAIHLGGRMLEATPEVQHLPGGDVVALRFFAPGSDRMLVAVHMNLETAALIAEDIATDADAPIEYALTPDLDPTPAAGARDLADDLSQFPDRGDALLEVPR